MEDSEYEKLKEEKDGDLVCWRKRKGKPIQIVCGVPEYGVFKRFQQELEGDEVAAAKNLVVQTAIVPSDPIAVVAILDKYPPAIARLAKAVQELGAGETDLEGN